MSNTTPAVVSASHREQLEELAECALGAARAAGATGAEVDVSRSQGLTVSARLGEVETLEHQCDRGLEITVYLGGRKASASSSDFEPGAIEDAARQACAIARHGSEDPCAGLAAAESMAVDPPDLELWHPWELNAETAIELALACEQAGRDCDPRIGNSEGASCGSYAGESVYANSHGFLHYNRGTRHGISCTLVAGSGGAMQRDFWYSSARRSDELDSAEAVGAEAARRALARLDPRPIATGKYPVLYNPQMAAGLWQSLIGAISGASIYRRASFLLDRVGEAIFPPGVELAEFPLIPGAIGSSAVDGEGLARRQRAWVEDGVLQGYVLSSYSARKLGLQSTGNAGGVRNFSARPGDKSFAELLRAMGTGLLVTEMMGSGGNPVTGDYSRGASGFWVEGGAIAHPVEGVTVAGNLREMFKAVAEIGTDVYLPSNVRTGSVLIEEMTVAAG